MIDHPLTKRINFTGSSRVGRIIARRAAEHLKPCLLELGGKAPAIVLDDADLEAAANGVKFGAFMNQGQICMSTEKVVVDDTIADAFVALFAEKTRALVTGEPSGQVHVASCVDRDTVEHVAALLDDAVAKGAEVVAGGDVPGDRRNHGADHRRQGDTGDAALWRGEFRPDHGGDPGTRRGPRHRNRQ